MTFRCTLVRESDGARCLLKVEHVGKAPCKFADSPAVSEVRQERTGVRKRAEHPQNVDRSLPGKFRTKAEARYAQYLEGLRLAGEIERWEYELFSLPVGIRCRYRFDFYVVVKRHDFLGAMRYEIQIHEPKGPHRFREKGTIKLKAAAKQYPEFRFFLALYNRGQWDIQEIKG